MALPSNFLLPVSFGEGRRDGPRRPINPRGPNLSKRQTKSFETPDERCGGRRGTDTWADALPAASCRAKRWCNKFAGAGRSLLPRTNAGFQQIACGVVPGELRRHGCNAAHEAGGGADGGRATLRAPFNGERRRNRAALKRRPGQMCVCSARAPVHAPADGRALASGGCAALGSMLCLETLDCVGPRPLGGLRRRPGRWAHSSAEPGWRYQQQQYP